MDCKVVFKDEYIDNVTEENGNLVEICINSRIIEEGGERVVEVRDLEMLFDYSKRLSEEEEVEREYEERVGDCYEELVREELISRTKMACYRQRGSDPMEVSEGIQYNECLLGEVPNYVVVKQIESAGKGESEYVNVACGSSNGRLEIYIRAYSDISDMLPKN